MHREYIAGPVSIADFASWPWIAAYKSQGQNLEDFPALNRWFEQAVDANPPPAVSGRRLKLNYATQAKARPPSFIVFCSRADAVPESYLRYLVNSLRGFFDLPGTPIRVTLREKANPFAHKRKRKS